MYLAFHAFQRATTILKDVVDINSKKRNVDKVGRRYFYFFCLNSRQATDPAPRKPIILVPASRGIHSPPLHLNAQQGIPHQLTEVDPSSWKTYQATPSHNSILSRSSSWWFVHKHLLGWLLGPTKDVSNITHFCISPTNTCSSFFNLTMVNVFY